MSNALDLKFDTVYLTKASPIHYWPSGWKVRRLRDEQDDSSSVLFTLVDDVSNKYGPQFLRCKDVEELGPLNIQESDVEMTEFLNEDMKEFKNLSAQEMKCIVNAKDVDYYARDDSTPGWRRKRRLGDGFYKTFIYRTTSKPKKQLIIPWEYIKPEYKWAAMDKDGIIWIYGEEPLCFEDHWSCTGHECQQNSLQGINIDTTDIDWKESLVKRPDGDV